MSIHSEIRPGAIVFVLDRPGLVLEARVLEVEPPAEAPFLSVQHALVQRAGYLPERVPFHRVYATKFGEGTCRCCGNPPSRPYRSRNKRGEIVEGCVDAFHTDGVMSEDDEAWHWRPTAVKVREDAAKRLAALLG